MKHTNIMVIFCEWGLIRGTKNELVDKIKVAVNKFKEKITPIDDWAILDSSYAGWGYNYEISEINEMRNYIKIISNENLNISLRAKIKIEIKQIKNDVYAFCKSIKYVNRTNAYYRKPYLSLVNIDDFFIELINLLVDDQNTIITSFEERYGITDNGNLFSEYKEDKDNLEKLLKL